jgi:hypothetical protein
VGPRGNQIVTEGDCILHFSADPLDGASVRPLGDLWRTGALPEPVPPLTPSRHVERPGGEGRAGAAGAAAFACVLAGLFVVGGARRRHRVAERQQPSMLIAQLRNWRRRGGDA